MTCVFSSTSFTGWSNAKYDSLISQALRCVGVGLDGAHTRIQLENLSQPQMGRDLRAIRMAHVGQPDGAKEDGIGGTCRFLGTGRHIQPGFLEISGPCQQVLVIQAKSANPLACRANNGNGRICYVDADTVALYDGNLEARFDHDKCYHSRI